MRVTQSWLAEYVEIGERSAEELGEAFVTVGLEIEEIHPAPDVRGPVVVGRVLGIEELTGFKKPIRWVQLDVGDANGTGEPQNVICGATNFAVGDLVVVTLPGTVLPGGFEVGARKTYGHLSEGMIASARELGIGTDHTGILVLPPGTAEPGTPAAELPDQVPKEVVQDRYDRLIALQEQISWEENKAQVGRTVEVLIAEGEALTRLLRRICARGTAVLVVEHDMDFVVKMADHVYVLNFGRPIFDGPPTSVMESAVVREAYIGAPEAAVEETA